MINSPLKGQFNGIILNLKNHAMEHGYYTLYGMINSLLKGQFNGIILNIKTKEAKHGYFA
jgi:hypothetical protein